MDAPIVSVIPGVDSCAWSPTHDTIGVVCSGIVRLMRVCFNGGTWSNSVPTHAVSRFEWACNGKKFATLHAGTECVRVWDTFAVCTIHEIENAIAFTWNPFDADVAAYNKRTAVSSQCRSLRFWNGGTVKERLEGLANWDSFLWPCKGLIMGTVDRPAGGGGKNTSAIDQLECYPELLTFPGLSWPPLCVGERDSDVYWAPDGSGRCLVVNIDGTVTLTRIGLGAPSCVVQAAFASGKGGRTRVAWSLDSARFFVQEEVRESLDIYIAGHLRPSAFGWTRVRAFRGICFNTVWHPDSCRIAFSLRDPPANNTVFIFNTITMNFTQSFRVPAHLWDKSCSPSVAVPTLGWSHDGSFFSVHRQDGDRKLFVFHQVPPSK